MSNLRLDTLHQLATNASAGRETRDRYYEGDLYLTRLGVNIPPEMGVFRTVLNYSRIYVDAIEERQDVEGFRLAGEDRTSDLLWSIWQANDLDEESHLAHLEALIQKRCYLIVGAGEDDLPIITAHSARGMHVEVDRATRRVTSAFQTWGDGADEPIQATLYERNESTDYVQDNAGQWEILDVREHNLGEVPVVPMVNRAKLGDLRGRTEMADVIPLTDAAARALTNLQFAAESVALPQRILTNIDQDAFVGADGSALEAFRAYIGHILALEKDATVTQFPGADLRNFHETISTYSRAVSAVTGLPPEYLGLTNSNPASAEAIRANEARLVKKVERRNKTFGEAWERALRLGLKLMGETSEAARVETVWRDPSTPTVSAKADAVLKLRTPGADGRPLISDDTAREMLGMSAEARKLEAERLVNPALARAGL